jgi:hypothetical protein
MPDVFTEVGPVDRASVPCYLHLFALQRAATLLVANPNS